MPLAGQRKRAEEASQSRRCRDVASARPTRQWLASKPSNCLSSGIFPRLCPGSQAQERTPNSLPKPSLSRIQFSESKFCVVQPSASRLINEYGIRGSRSRRSPDLSAPCACISAPASELGPSRPRRLRYWLHRPPRRCSQLRNHSACLNCPRAPYPPRRS